MEVAVPRQQQPKNQHNEDKIEFSRYSKHSRTVQRKADKIPEYGHNKQELKGEETMRCLKKNNAVGLETTITQGEQVNQPTKDKILKSSKSLGTTKTRKVEEIYKCDDTKLKLCKKGHETQKLTVSNKKRKFEGDLLNDDFEDVLKSRTRRRRMNDVMDVGQNPRKCHQCMKKKRTFCVSCTKCPKMYCMRCVNKWYPDMSVEEIASSCPFCRKNCNCNVCLCSRGMIKTSNRDISDYEKAQYLQYMINLLLPFLKQICHEQSQEDQIEAKLLGKSSFEIEIPQSLCGDVERVYCDHCATSIIDFHRSCPYCSYELCLSCCQEIRDGSITPRAELKFPYVNRGYDYMHGGDPLPVPCDLETLEGHIEPSTVWNAKSDGSISCAPKELGGCGSAVLELRCIFPDGWISDLETKACNMLKLWEIKHTTLQQKAASSSYTFLRKEAIKEGINDNNIYCPDSSSTKNEGLLLFQKHWANGEPIIVRDVLKQGTGLSWEPMVMWRALCENMVSEISSKMSEVKAIDCLANCEVWSHCPIWSN